MRESLYVKERDGEMNTKSYAKHRRKRVERERD
jgi:hypothetical protein